MLYTLPKMPYAYDALEPYIDAKTMEIHYTKHHQTYVDNLNEALKKHPQIADIPLNALLSNLTQVPEDIRMTIRNNGGGHENHSLFWYWMTPHNGGGPAKGTVGTEIEKVFGDFETFKKQMSEAAKTRFGSGWAWLVLNKEGKLAVTSTANQDNPVSEGMMPLLGLDVWEHAYYLKYQNKRVDYIAAWWNVVDWSAVEELFRKHA